MDFQTLLKSLNKINKQIYMSVTTYRCTMSKWGHSFHRLTQFNGWHHMQRMLHCYTVYCCYTCFATAKTMYLYLL